MIRKDLESVRHALEEHLAAINENSSEIQALFDYIHQLELKVDKMSQRIDQLQMTTSSEPIAEKPYISPLNQTERKIFLVLYTEEAPLNFQELASRSGIPISSISECISTLVEKGIPLHRSYINNQLFFKLDKQFKELQAKENVINLSLQSFME